MIYVDTPVKDWAKKYHLDQNGDRACGACKKTFPEPRAFRIQGYVGIEWRCPCKGLYSSSALMTPITQEKKKFWERVLK